MTTILRFLSQEAYGSIDKYVLAAAADRGSRIHEACEAYDLYGDLPDDEEEYDIYNYVLAYASFCADYKPVWIAIEESITDGETAGTVDRIGSIKSVDGLITLDIKSSKSIHIDSVSAQTGKYKNIYSKLYPDMPLTACYALHLKSDGTYGFDPKKPLDVARGREVWNACYNLHKIIENGGKHDE